MSTLATLLLLWGLSLGPAAEAATFIETRPDLWAEAGSLREPWANLTLVCRARLPTSDFQLFKDGVAVEGPRRHEVGMERRFPVGAVSEGSQGLYRCRCALSDSWTQMSNLVEVTGPGTLPAPTLSSWPVAWVTPGLTTTLRCRAGLRGVTFLLRREGDPQFLELAEAPQAAEASFRVHRAGNYSCSYVTHEGGAPSEPSAPVAVEDMAQPPAPRLSVDVDAAAAVLPPGGQASLRCVAPLPGVEFQLRRGAREELGGSRWSTSPDRVVFELKAPEAAEAAGGGLYTCRYQLRGEGAAWSADSAPVELLLSDGSLPAPELSAESATPLSEPGARVTLRCRAPRAGPRFALVREDAGAGRRVRALRSPRGPEARFELRDVSPLDSGNYSCVYAGDAPPAGSAPSAALELRLDGPLPKPRLRPLWSGKVRPGRDAALRCEAPVAHESLELLAAAAGEVVASAYGPSEDLVLTYVGPRHAGNYSCRYRSRWPLASEPSDPVELQVAER